MKTNYLFLLTILTIFLLIVNIVLFIEPKNQLELPQEQQPVFIWNDDLESIPVDSTPILLEFSSKNQDTIYIGSLDSYDKSEYQFTITDDSITVTDFGRIVGTVKVEGQLEQLLIKDNE
jgi:hypothetical protein